MGLPPLTRRKNGCSPLSLFTVCIFEGNLDRVLIPVMFICTIDLRDNPNPKGDSADLIFKGVTIEVLPSGDCLALQDIYNITNGLL
jgi:hypothetical protein